jgi:hypothetical protein
VETSLIKWMNVREATSLYGTHFHFFNVSSFRQIQFGNNESEQLSAAFIQNCSRNSFLQRAVAVAEMVTAD